MATECVTKRNLVVKIYKIFVILCISDIICINTCINTLTTYYIKVNNFIIQFQLQDRRKDVPPVHLFLPVVRIHEHYRYNSS